MTKTIAEQEFNKFIEDSIDGGTNTRVEVKGSVLDTAAEALRAEVVNAPPRADRELLNVEVTNVTDGTYSYYVDVRQLRYISIACHGTTSNQLTMTVHASNDDATSGSGASVYADVTNDWFGSASIALLNTQVHVDSPAIVATWVKITFVANSGGANICDWELTVRGG